MTAFEMFKNAFNEIKKEDAVFDVPVDIDVDHFIDEDFDVQFDISQIGISYTAKEKEYW